MSSILLPLSPRRAHPFPPGALSWRAVARVLGPRWRTLAAWQGLATLAGAGALAPLVNAALDGLLRTTGLAAISNFDIVAFVLSPAGIGWVLLATTLVLSLFLLQHAGLVLLTADGHERDTPTGALARVVQSLPALLGIAWRQLAVLALVAAPAVAIVALLARPLLARHDVNWYLDTRPPEAVRVVAVAAALALAVAGVATWLLARWSLAIPAALHDGLDGRDAMRTSWRMTRGQGGALAWRIGGWWGALFAANLALTTATAALGGTLAARAGTRLATLVPVVWTTLALLAAISVAWVLLGHAGHARLVNAAWRADGGGDVRGEAIDRAGAPAPWVLATLLALLVAGSSAVGAWWVRGVAVPEAVQVTGHRGSGAAPENSLAAIRAAIDAGADWVEIDVQRTKDGAVIVVHDADLARVANVPRKVWTMTLAEVRRADLGWRSGGRFAGERIPTLREVLALADGRVGVNVELKYNRPDPALLGAVLAVVDSAGARGRISLTSLELAPLVEAARRAPAVPTGLIVTRALGRVDRLPVDFLSVNRALATEAFIDRARRAGKPVHVWTVNDRRSMTRLLDLGAVNLITDVPAEAAAVVAAREALPPEAQVALHVRALLARR